MPQYHFGRILLILTIFVTSMSYGQRRTKEAFDVLNYKFEVALNDSTDQIKVQATITILYNESLPIFTQLDLANQTENGYGMLVSALSVNDRPTAFAHSSDLLKITTPSAIQVRDTVLIKMTYSGMPDSGLVISESAAGKRTFFAEHWPNKAHRWLPVIDHPSEKATCEFVITAPAHYLVVANGDKQVEELLGEGRKKTIWKMENPIPTKVMVIGVADFVTKKMDEEGVITAWAYADASEEAFNDFSEAPAVLKLLKDFLGEYPFTKCDQVESTTKFGGMENAGNIFYPESSINGEQKINVTIAHEIGHQWFGDAVTESDWADVWISEGFATFLENYYVLNVLGKDRLLIKLKEEEKNILTFQRRNPTQTIVQQNITSLDAILSTLVYEKAAWMLRSLSQKVGDETFRQIVRTFYERYKYDNASTQDFINVAKEVSLLDLDIFFYQWLYVAGSPKIAFKWKYKKNKLLLEFEQKSDHVYQLDLDIQMKYEGMNFEIKRIHLSQKYQSFEISCPEPSSLVIDPLNLVLGKISKM